MYEMCLLSNSLGSLQGFQSLLISWFYDTSNNAIRPICQTFILDFPILVMLLYNDFKRAADKEHKFLSQSHKEK